MQFTLSFVALAALALVATVEARPTGMDVLKRDSAGPSAGSSSSPAGVTILTDDEMDNWLSTTAANLTFIGNPFSKRVPNTLGRRDTTVTYCTKRVDSVCGGTCQVYTGGPTCLDASGTSCIAATADVGFCDKGGCGGSCNQFSSCGTTLENGFCDTPGTKSILVGGPPTSS